MTDKEHSVPAEQTIGLPILQDEGGDGGGGRCGTGKAPQMGQSKNARKRTVVLVLINLFMIAHLIQWLIMGVTVSPIEPSEAMETLEIGVVNAGAIMFVIAIVGTIIFGRFFCGWGCHMVSLQDFCAVTMARIGIRPKPFRSRLMMLIPIVLGFYMFLWPTFKRLVLRPALEASGIEWPVWLRPVNDIYHFSQELIVEDYWASMPPWPMAIVFLIVCGFVAVYFLGAKGFCTYACPYAGFFKPLDKIAITRVVVNDDCGQCGYCTSVCTSNVRVSEEVRDFGMVIDNGCMKTLDCVSACPNEALSLKMAGPALFKKPRNPDSAVAAQAKKDRRYDLTLGEDLVAVVIFALSFYGTRGLFDRVPMLMAGGLAAVVTMMCVQCYWLVKREHVRFHKFQLKSKGKIRFGGLVLGVLTLVMVGVSVWGGHTKFARWRGDMNYAMMDVPSDVLVRPDFMASPSMNERAERALNWYKRSGSFDEGGFGWTLHPDYRVRMAYCYSMMGDYDAALGELRRVIAEGNPTDALIVQAGQLAERSSGDVMKLLDMYREGLAAHPDLHLIRAELAKNAWSMRDEERAMSMWDYEPQENELGFVMARAGFEAFRGDIVEVEALYRKAVEMVPDQDGNKAGWYIDVARGAATFQIRSLMEELAVKATQSPDATGLTWLSAGELANALGQMELSVERAEKALSMPGADRSMVLQRASGIIAGSGLEGTLERGLDLLRRAHERAENEYDRKYIIEKMIRFGVIFRNNEILDEAFGLYRAMAERRTDVPIFFMDMAFYLNQAGRFQEAAEAMEYAANLDERNAVIAQRVAELYRELGDADRVQQWVDETQRRYELLNNSESP